MNKHVLSLTCAVLLGVSALNACGQSGEARARTVFASSHVTGAKIIAFGERYVGYPYALTGSTPKKGFSCIGFVWYVFQHFGIDMPGNLGTAIVSYRRIAERALTPGDIVFFQNTWWKGVSHVAIYIGQGRVLHAENPSRGVNISSLSKDPSEGNYWQEHYLVSERPLAGKGYDPAPTTRDPSSNGKDSMALVSVQSLNFRRDHGTRAAVVAVLPHGTPMSVLGQWHKWLHVSLKDGTTGWVVKAGVTVKSGSHPARPPATKQSAIVQINGLHMHSQPSVGATILASLRFGQRVAILKKVPGWYEIAVNGRLHGWSVERYLKPVVSQASPKNSSKRTYGVVAGVNVHSGPSISASVIARTSKGDVVAIVERQGSFAHIHDQHGLNGWILTRFITHRPGTKSTHPTAKKRTQITGSVTIKAHLRMGPSMNARILQWVEAGTRVAVLETADDWDRVRIPSKQSGYVFAQFIRRS